MAFAVKRYNSLLSDAINWIIANQTKLTDFNEGSQIRTFLEAIMLVIEQLYIKVKIGFSKELNNVPFYIFNFSQKQSEKAAGNVKFSRTGTSGTDSIDSGILISTADGTQFVTTAAASITPGNTESADVPIQAVEGGKNGNVPADTITIIITPINIAGIAVNNDAATTGGLNSESTDEYMKRFREYIEGLGQSNTYGLIAGAKSVAGVRSASITEHFPPSSGYNVTLYIDDGAGNASQALIDQVALVIIGDGTALYPGYKAAGINVRILAPTKVNVTVTVEITDDGTVTQEALTLLVSQAIQDYINNLENGADVIRNKLIEVIMSIDGVSDIDLTLPAANTTINADQIARTDESLITITFAT